MWCVCVHIHVCVVCFAFLKLEDPTTYLYIGQKNEDRKIPREGLRNSTRTEIFHEDREILRGQRNSMKTEKFHVKGREIL